MKIPGLSFWANPNEGATNTSGFSALPGGERFYVGAPFTRLGYFGSWWTSTQCYDYPTNAWGIVIAYNNFFKLRSPDNIVSGDIQSDALKTNNSESLIKRIEEINFEQDFHD